FFILIFLFINAVVFSEQTNKGPQQTLTLINEGKNDEAIAQIKNDLLQKETADKYILIAIAYIEEEQFFLAEESLNKALSLQPKAVPAYYMLAMLYEKQKLWDKAIQKWENICKYTKNEKLKELAQKHLEQLKGDL
uniref:tetratricopeptide repeat protein n=1 Tax=Candidatus Ruminimicrobium bovinum TaxID=3242779 RepID=UPI0039B87533